MAKYTVINAGQLKPAFIKRLQDIVGKAHVSVKNIDRINYSRDSNFKGAIQAKFGKVINFPDIIAWPQTTEEVQSIVKLAIEFKVPIIPYGAGSGVCGGTVPVHGGLVVDLKRMNRLVKVDPENLTAEIEAGIMGQVLENELERKGFTLGHFPSSIICASFGGYLAARSAGQKSNLYGKIEDMVLDLEIVTGRGNIVRTRYMTGHKGIDYNHIFMGSEGVLGLITKATVKIMPLPESTSFLAIRFDNMQTGMEAVRRMMQAGVRPAVVRLYDELDTLMLLSTSSSEKKNSFQNKIKHEINELIKIKSLKIALNASSLATNLTRHLPCGCGLVLMFEGHARLVKEFQQMSLQISQELGGEDLGEGPAKAWYRKRYAISYNVSPLFHSGIFTDTIEVATTWDNLYALYEGMVKVLKKDTMIMAHMSHVYHEGGSLYFTFAAPIKSLRKAERLYDKVWDKALATCQKLGGVLSHHHGIGRLKMKYMDDEWGEGAELMKRFKKYFDPASIMNPGKLLGEDLKRKKKAA